MRIRALLLATMVAACGGEKKDAPAGDDNSSATAGEKTTGPDEVNQGDSKAPTAGKAVRVAPSSADAKPSCREARYTKAIADLKVEMSLAIEGKPFALEFDASKAFEGSKVWPKSGKTLAACGAVRPRNGKEAVSLFTQFHSGGKHVMRMQMINIPGGYHLLSGGSIAAVIDLPGNEEAVALSFRGGTYTIEPKPAKPGPVSIVFEDGTGILLGSKKEKFTFSGKITGTFEK